MRKDENTIVLSDVDGTLVRGSLVLHHAVHLHRNRVIDLGRLPERWLKEQKNEKLIRALAESYREAIIGKTANEINAVGFAHDFASDSSRLYSTVERVKAVKDGGARVVLISGSPDFLITPFASVFGFESAASAYKTDKRGRFTGEIEGMFSGEAKASYLRKLGLDSYRHVIAFGDTGSDKPLFDAAHVSVLVEPNRETRAKLGSLVTEIVEH